MTNCIRLSDGNKMPVFGLGTWLSQPGEVKEALTNALNLGYKHIDCAWAYFNENEIGDTLEDFFKSGKVKREDLFITSKLWNAFHRPELVSIGCQETLDNLKLDYLDLFLIHWPISIKPGNIFPDETKFKDEIDEVNLKDTWKEMEKLVDSGKVRSIGVSNFNIKQLHYILDNSRIKPAVIQVEVQIYLPNKKLVDFATKNNIITTAYSPLGGAESRPDVVANEERPLKDSEVLKIAKKLNATPAQILISYILHRGIVCIPKSTSADRLKENIKATEIKLSDEDFEILNNRNIHQRANNPILFKLHKNYPFNED